MLRAFVLALSLLTAGMAHGALLLFDDFEYSVSRNPGVLPGATGSAFSTTGPWGNAKAVNITGSSVGYLYTATSIPGYNGTFPGGGSRVLVMEAPNVDGGSDFYLQYGSGDNPADNNLVPGSVWFQWWQYTNHYGSELSGIESRHKFIYPTTDGWPSNSNKWLLEFSSVPHNTQSNDTAPFGSPTSGGQFYLISRDNTDPCWNEPWPCSSPNYSPAYPDNHGKLGTFLSSNNYIPANEWTLIKIHYDTSNSSSGVFEAWKKPSGGSWTKIIEWVGGTTTNFTWSGFAAGGHRGFRMPTTIGWTTTTGGAWYYMDDFAMADSEASLPTYDGGGALSAPGNTRWRTRPRRRRVR